jgi:hypothetical protein
MATKVSLSSVVDIFMKRVHLEELTKTVNYIFSVLREEHRLRVFENRVLRRIFGPKSDEVTGEWRKLHNE